MCNKLFVDNVNMKNFILGGKSEFIISNERSGNLFHFKVSRSDKANMYFVSVLMSDGNYIYMGFLNKDLEFIVGSSGQGSTDMIEIKALMYVLKNSMSLPDFVKLQHIGKCCRCGRKLKDEVSIKRGIGPECLKKHGGGW